MILDPFERFLGVRREADPLTLLGLTPEQASPAEVEAALRARIAKIYSHPDGRSEEAEMVRGRLRAAADALRDPQRRWRFIPGAEPPARTRGTEGNGARRLVMTPRPAPRLTEFDRQAMGVLVGCGGWNAESRARLVSLAAAHGVTVQGLQRVITGLSDYAKSHGPRLGVPEITSGRPMPDPLPPPEPTYVDRVVSNVAAELKGESPGATMRVSALFAALTLVAGVVALWVILSGNDPEPAPAAVVEPPTVPDGNDAAAAPPAPARPEPARPAQFRDPPTFAGEALPDAAVQAADLCPALLRELDVLGRKVEVADGDLSEAVYRSWDESVRTLATGWVLVDTGLQRDIERRLLMILSLAETWPQVSDRLLAGVAPTSMRWVEPLDLWRDAWRVGFVGRLAGDATLPPLLVEEARRRLGAALAPIAADAVPEGFERAAAARLDRLVVTLVDGLELDPDTYDAWELWLAARRRISDDDGYNAALLDAVELILETETDLSRAGPSRNVLGRLLLAADFEESEVVRERTLALFDDEAIDPHDLWLLTSLLVHLDTSPWFGAHLLVTADATMRERARICDRVRRHWPPIGAPAPPAGSAHGTGVAVDADAAARWVDLVERAIGERAGDEPDRLMEQLAEACALNEAAVLLAAKQPVEAQVLMNRIEQRAWTGDLGARTAGSIGQAVGADGAWAAAYKELGRVAEDRLSALAGLRRNAGSDLGPTDAALLVREAYRGTPQEIRAEARAVLLELFRSGPTVALELLDQFPDAPTTESVSDFLARATDGVLPSSRSEEWSRVTRRALVEHALSLRYLGRQRFDRLSAAIADCFENRRVALKGEAQRGSTPERPESAAERLVDAWFDHASTLIVSEPVPDDLAGLQRRMTIRERLVDGAMQRFVATQIGILDLLAYVTVAEQPVVADDVRALLRTSAAARAAADHVLEQALIAERSALPLWRLRMSVDAKGPTAGRDGAAVPWLAAIMMAATGAPDDTWRDRLEALDPGDPEAYFLLAEEIADAVNDGETRALARRLFGLAGVLDPDGLGRSACLALADLAEDEAERRRLLALGWLIDERSGSSTPEARLAEPRSDQDAVTAVVDAFSHYRRGQGARALAALREEGATELLEAHEEVLRGGLRRFVEDCKLYRGPLRPTLSETDVTRMLLLELALLSGSDRPWSAELLLTRGRPLIEVDPDQLHEALGVDAERPVYRNGRWVTAPSD